MKCMQLFSVLSVANDDIIEMNRSISWTMLTNTDCRASEIKSRFRNWQVCSSKCQTYSDIRTLTSHKNIADSKIIFMTIHDEILV